MPWFPSRGQAAAEPFATATAAVQAAAAAAPTKWREVEGEGGRERGGRRG